MPVEILVALDDDFEIVGLHDLGKTAHSPFASA
jgi:hypothetical protein